MNEIQEQEISCNVECKKEVLIFDTDNFESSDEDNAENDQCNISQEKKISENDIENTDIERDEESNGKPDENLKSKIVEELKSTNENIFKSVQIKEPLKPIKTLQTLALAKRPSNSIVKQGFMEKKTDGLVFKWKRRYFVLTPEKLFFFEDEKKSKVIGCINIKLIPMLVQMNERKIILDFEGESENIILKCYNDLDSKEWGSWLEKVSKFHSKSNKIFLRTIIKPVYSQSNTMSEREFINEASTGDILLFYTNHVGAKLQRGLTNSEFDHVAMIVKFQSGDVVVFESNQHSGVAMFEWNQFIRGFKLYEKVTYRKLISHRKEEIEHDLLKFVKINLGRKYSLNISKLFSFDSDFSWDMVSKDTARGYFCSELIAKAYKGAGLFDKVKSSCRYWPVDFSEKKLTTLKKGAVLGPEQVIVLNKHIKKIL